MMELLAVCDGVYWALQQNLRLKQGSLHMDLFVEDIRSSLRDYEDSQVCYVHRTANVATHRMVKLAISSTSDFCWFEEPLDLIVRALLESI
ncbi:hypothetical protein D8674_010107 [Pyrus ussuriensis x Pyrus communis]|uniref:Uncharacterized protein n=1 Tax=Pyrus ussuriensis x Pyrus communis TaxID=2448454 RepID=A0A5N5F9U0_9ROSA|nr:hypothetical protein D8674_010107 [Pyrus ussuriensis x Pyrus communis]